MKPRLLKILASATLLLSGLPTPAVAQQPAAAQQQPETTLRILALPPRTEHPPLFLIQEKAAVLPLETASSRLTGPYQAKAAKRWRFALTATPAEANKPIPLVANCKSLPSAAEQLVVLIRKPGAETSYASFAMDISQSALKGRQFLVINLSPTEIAGDIGGSRQAFPPGKLVTVSPKGNISSDLCHAAFFTGAPDGKWKPFFSTNWPLNDKIRGLVFFYQPPGSDKILMHTITDFL